MQSDFERTGKLQRKIDIYYRDAGGWVYACSTQWWRRCTDAAQNWADIHLAGAVKDSRGRRCVRARFT